MNVLSLFDGCSGGQQALERAGIKYNKYYASEIDKYAIKVTQHNYPDTIQLGDVTKIKVKLLCLSEVYSYICNYDSNLQSNISEWEVLYWLNKNFTFSAKIRTQKPNERQEVSEPPLYNALRKYGFQTVKWEVLESLETIQEAEAMEKKMILKHHNNYNVASGGMTMTFTDDIRKKISESQLGKPKTETQKKRISETLKKRFSKEENRKTISEKMKKVMWRKDVRENYLKGREKIDFQERSRQKKETEEKKRIVLLTKLSENYVDGMKLTELHKITGISYNFIRRNKLRWLSMREDTTSLKGK